MLASAGALGVALLLNPHARSEVGHPVDGVTAIIDASALETDVFNAQYCGGVLVAPRAVVTAAHCVDERDARQIHVLVGADNLCRDRRIDGQRIPVRAISVHPSYDRETAVSDIAVLHLETPANDDDVRSVPEWDGSEALGVAFGWGRASLGGLPACRLMQVPLRIHPPDVCRQQIAGTSGRTFDEDTMLCASPRDRAWDTCVGDSGGPLLLGTELDAAPVVGLVSWGVGCGQGVPGVYSRMDRWAGGW